ncbi:serine/arginine repetitive matrix protein 5-like [Palaemon carinicauda]|uniref:serine/arginine repetitive matrix protein 5-like n=1 Tax=Palaemon carinicauda TaxID=392227 RepID=UPI0035B698D9
MGVELKARKDQLAALKGKNASEISACESAVEVGTDQTCHAPRSRPLPSSQDQGRKYVEGRKGVRATYPWSAVASSSPVAISQAAHDRHGKGVSEVIVSSPSPSPRCRWQYEASRPTKRRWIQQADQTRSRFPLSSSAEPFPSDDDWDASPAKKSKPRDGRKERSPLPSGDKGPSREPSPATSVTRQPSPSESRDPAVVAKSFLTVMQEQLVSLVQTFRCPPPQSSRRKDDKLPVKKSASKRERNSSPLQDDRQPRSRSEGKLRHSSPRETCRDSSSARRRVSPSSRRRQDAYDSCCQEASVSRS